MALEPRRAFPWTPRLQRGGENGIIRGMKMKLCVMAVAAAAAGAVFGGALDFAWMKGVTDKDPVSYQVGETMTFTLSLEDLDGSLPDSQIYYLVDASYQQAVNLLPEEKRKLLVQL